MPPAGGLRERRLGLAGDLDPGRLARVWRGVSPAAPGPWRSWVRRCDTLSSGRGRASSRAGREHGFSQRRTRSPSRRRRPAPFAWLPARRGGAGRQRAPREVVRRCREFRAAGGSGAFQIAGRPARFRGRPRARWQGAGPGRASRKASRALPLAHRASSGFRSCARDGKLLAAQGGGEGPKELQAWHACAPRGADCG